MDPTGTKHHRHPDTNGISMMLRLLLVLALLLPANAEAIVQIQEAVASNGLRILLTEAHNVPMVAMRLILPAGSRFDPPGRAGAASLMATMLTDHTAKHDHHAWASLLDMHAIQLHAGVDRDACFIDLQALTEEVPFSVSLLAEAVLHPGWSPKRFAMLKENRLAALKKTLEDPRSRGEQALAKLLFPGHPYGHPPEGDLEGVANVELEDLKRIFALQFHPHGAVLAVSGDIDMQRVLKIVENRLASWKGKASLGIEDLSAPRQPKPASRHIAMPTKQTTLMFATLGPARKDADFFPMLVLNHVLGGGGFASVLMEEVREKRGLTYGVYSYFIPLARPGPFVIALQTRNNEADSAADTVRKIMRDLAHRGVKKERIKAAKAHLIGSFPQRIDSNRERVALMAMIGFYKLPLNYLNVWAEKIASVSPEAVNEIARRRLDPSRWVFVRVGP